MLWPEHFDVGITVGECNYAVSLGDSAIDEPYAYVGPWTPRSGPFWTESFGTARRLRELDDIAAFFGRRPSQPVEAETAHRSAQKAHSTTAASCP